MPAHFSLPGVGTEDQAYLRCLLPIVAATALKLKEPKSKALLYCHPLVNAKLYGITKKFGPLLDDQQCQLAAVLILNRFNRRNLSTSMGNKVTRIICTKVHRSSFLLVLLCSAYIAVGWVGKLDRYNCYMNTRIC